MKQETTSRRFLPLCIFALSLFFHLYKLGYGEFGNDETIITTASVWFLHGLINPLFFGSIFIFDHPPMMVLINVPFVLIFGTSEFLLRFPHAVFGAASTVLVYLVGKKLYNEKVAILAVALYMVSGISAVHRLAQGIGIYVFFTLLTFYYLISFLRDERGQDERFHLILASISLSIATYTYLEAILFLPALLYLIVRKKGLSALKDKNVLMAGSVYGSALVVFFLLWYGMPTVAKRLGYVSSSAEAGNLAHLLSRASGFGAFNALSIFKQYVSYNSIFYVALLLMGIVAGIYFSRQNWNFLANLIYVFPHLFVWTFLFKNMMMHPMYDVPFVALLAAAGLGKLFEVLSDSSRLRWVLCIAIVLTLGLSGWHNYVLYNQDSIEPSARNLVFFAPGPRSRLTRLGSKAAGYYVRKNSQDVTEQVFTYGSGSAAFYAGRLDRDHGIRRGLSQGNIRNSDTLAEAISLSESWPKVRYLIITKDCEILWDYAEARYSLEAIVYVEDKPSLYIFNATKSASSTSPQIIISEQCEKLYDQEYGHWRETIPWFLPMAQERL